MGTQTSTLQLLMIDGLSGPAGKAGGALKRLGIETQNVQGVLASLGLAFSAYEAVRFGKEALSAWGDQEAVLGQIGRRLKANKVDMAGLNDTIYEAAQKTASAISDIDKAADRMAQTGKGLDYIRENLATVAAGAKITHADYAAFAGTVDSVSRTMGVSVKEAVDLIVTSFNRSAIPIETMLAGLDKVGLQAAQNGWKGADGMAKLLAVIEKIAPEVGGAELAFTTFGKMMAQLTTAKVEKRFEKIGIDIDAEIAAGLKKGYSPLETEIITIYKELAKHNAKIGEMVLTPDTQKMVLAWVKNWEKAHQAHIDITKGMVGATDNAMTEINETANAGMQRLSTAWEKFKQDFGKMEVDQGFVEGLQSLIPLLSELTRVMGSYMTSNAQMVEDFKAVFAEGKTFYERMKALQDAAFGRSEKPEIEGMPGAGLPRPRPTESEMARGRRRPGFTTRQAASDFAEEAAKAPGAGLEPEGATVPWPAEPPTPKPWPETPPPPMPERPALATGLADAFADLPAQAEAAGRETGKGFVDGLKSELAGAEDYVKGFASKLGGLLSFSSHPEVVPNIAPATRNPVSVGPGAHASSLFRGLMRDAAPRPQE